MVQPRLGAIWAQTDSGVIGRNGDMPWHVPEDLAYFKKTTLGAPVIMGRKTWESFPPRFRPLPGRVNIVISSSVAEPQEKDGAFWMPSLQAACSFAAFLPVPEDHPNDAPTAWIIGGGSLYAQALEAESLPGFGALSRCVITRFYCQEGNEITGDTYAPDISAREDFKLASESPWEKSDSGYLLDAEGGKNPVYYCMQIFDRL